MFWKSGRRSMNRVPGESGRTCLKEVALDGESAVEDAENFDVL
jgi:hypothetical protein